MHRRPSSRARRMTVGLLSAAAVLVAPFMSAQASSADPESADSVTLAGPLTAEMAELLELQPGGVQVSDNAMAWDDGATVVVWPDPGADQAPAGLGSNVRADVAQAMGLTDVAASADVSAMGSWSSCPYDWYCFYTDSNWDGIRYQFSSTCSDYASNWGFNNQTTSWANRGGSGKTIYALDYNGGSLLWDELQGTSDSYVGSNDNNRMSYWRCTYNG